MKKIIFAMSLMVLGIVVDGMCGIAVTSSKHTHKIKKHHYKSHSSSMETNYMAGRFRKPPVW